jgi:hypothetical protein
MNDFAVLYLFGYLITVMVMNFNMYHDNDEWKLLGILGWMFISIGIWWAIAVVWLWIQAEKMTVYTKKFKE